MPESSAPSGIDAAPNQPIPTDNHTDNATPTISLAPSDNVTSAMPTPKPIPVFGPIQLRKRTVLVSPDKDTEIASTTGISPGERVVSGNVTIRIPKGAVSASAEVEFIERVPVGSTGIKMLRLFELTAKDLQSGEKITRFDRDIEISVKHDPRELAGLNPDSLRLYYLDEKTRQWLPVSSVYDRTQNVLTATVNHFTSFGEQADPVLNGPGRVMAADVSLHAGTAIFNYPIELPPGPGGFQPKAELNYNSGVADETKNRRSTASWVGMGWTLNFGSVSYDAQTRRYYLDLNGGSYEFVSTEDGYISTNPEMYFKITNPATNTWEVLDREGNYYRFGGTTDSEQYYFDGARRYYRYDLSLFRDTNDNTANITYARDIRGVSQNDTVRAAYPEYLRYGNMEVRFSSSYDVNDATDGYLRRDNPRTSSNSSAPKTMETRKLDAIEVKANGSLIRRYAFSYNTTDSVNSTDYGGIFYSGNHTLTSITQFGSDNTTSLPPMTFAYQGLQTYRHTSEGDYNGNPGNPASFSWPHLTTVNSGYGGKVIFSYSQLPAVPVNNVWSRQVVSDKTVNSGIVSNWWNTAWSSRKKLDFNANGISSNLSSFPVLVRLTTSNFEFGSAQSDGGDLRFIDTDGATVLDYEIERWTSSEAWVWVKVPTLTGNSTDD
ncbi:MAG: DUF2341 domain-containing protein, partial [Chloroflexi bacterium]|nr:DUF2341 domain-containing protein [Chloroflexota bacterium]